ncbi:MAG: NepR family anti-sigma factor [Pseudomonadota bacterium]
MTPKRGKSSQHPQIERSTPSEDRLGEIGDVLREKYADLQNEPIPDRLQRLIDALREAEHMDKKKS